MEVLALALGTAIMVTTAVLTVLYGKGLSGRWNPTVDPGLQASVRALSGEGRVRLELFSARGRSGTAVVVKGICNKLWLSREDTEGRPPEVPVEVSLRRETQIPTARAPDLDTGDRGFDAYFRVLGPPPIVHAILTDDMRSALLALRQRRGVVEVVAEKGELRVLVEGASASREGELKAVAVAALELAPRLALPDDLPGQLARNAGESLRPEVRLRQLLTLSREYSGHSATHDALRTASRDPDPEVRLRAAIALGDEGQDVLLALALNARVDDSCASRAVDALGPRLPAGRAAALFERGPLLSRSSVSALSRGRQPEAVAVLGHVLATQGGDLAALAADALVDLGLSQAEAPLIHALGAPDARARLAAAEALAQVGSVAAVGPLEEAGERVGGELRRVARRAVAEIQGRLVGAEPGQVSLAESDAGQLSLADDRSGGVSLSEEKPNRERVKT